ncbi:hypothetical protein A3J11_02875 [Candidatus Kaiserbacteria bacterium RIFCSPLOWO2_02_FULL_55_12]|uniref:Rod shape-determining protein MreD n=2 Tax=Candidatus Kaiseribacteriota TaxID=1752734 RepID=A0A1F6F1J1_9BACT|nr:MAG: hypothetical protein A3C94_01030 [Candidatus Kaiserbacteria bacterium RIFCSPHIGHO2_02_FULL_55_17]OGG79708.1 MAG: hypothetical protein A3J11_02875 [Candidatus Kaiserbacteria bacterium RIFCSPLOWO2_02_FULL_55_12]
MMRAALTLLPFVSAIFFPWPFTVLLALISVRWEPLVPLAVGLFADTLYYVPSAALVPVFTLSGAAVTVIALFVRSRLRTSIMR